MSVEQALTKINTEIEEKNNSYVRAVGNFLKEYLEIDPTAAEKILVEDKTITKSISKLRVEARKNTVDNVGVLTDQEGFELALKYFEIEPVDPTEAGALDVSLDDLL